jgi:hypothetical protein
LISFANGAHDVFKIHGIAGIGQGIQIDYVPCGSLRKHRPDEIGADKTRPACHQYCFVLSIHLILLNGFDFSSFSLDRIGWIMRMMYRNDKLIALGGLIKIITLNQLIKLTGLIS